MDRQTARLLAEAGLAAPSADNSQPIHFTWDGQCLQMAYDAARVAGKTFTPDSPATLLSVGAVLENLSQLDEQYTLGMTAELHTDASTIGAPYATVRVARSAPDLEHQEPLPLLKRHTNRFPYERKKAIPEAVKTLLGELEESGARLQIFDTRESIKPIADLTRQAAEIRFQTKEVHELLVHSLRYSTEQVEAGDGLDVRTLFLPPGGAAFLRLTSDWNRMRILNGMGAFKFLANADSKPLALSPMIVAVTGENHKQGALNAGKLLCRTWIKLNALGLAVHPYYVVADQMARLREGTVPHKLIPSAEQCRDRASSLFQLADDETHYMIFRVGYATREAPMSRRLPLEAVFTDLTR